MNDNRAQNVYVQISLWIEDNPDPPLGKEGRLIREYTKDFVQSGFTIEEIAEARRLYRRDYSYPKRSFNFFWDKAVQARNERLNLIEPLEAWVIVGKVHHYNIFAKPYEITLEEITEWASLESAKRILILINKLGWNGIYTNNEAADRARFCQAYETMSIRLTNEEVWSTPEALLPESKNIRLLTEGINALSKLKIKE